MTTKVLLTGATGFVGSALCAHLSRAGYAVRAAVRSSDRAQADAGETIVVGDIADTQSLRAAVNGVDVIVHTAARAHIMRDTSPDPSAAFRRVNVDGTLSLAAQAAEAGARRFIFLSSIKVNGEETLPGRPFRSDDAPNPRDPYGESKLEAEAGLRQIAAASGMEVVIIRPPLVYGPSVRANFLTMMRWMQKALPLPLGGIDNRRSLVALDNLIDLISTCIDHGAAANQVFLVSDGEDLSTSQLLRRMSRALGRPDRLLAISPELIRGLGSLVGARDYARRLCGSLQVDISKTRDLLGWSPVVTVDEALRKTAQHFQSALHT